MARKTLLEEWQEQNSVRDGPPSQLLKQMRAIAEDLKKFSESPTARQIREGLQRFQESKVAERLMGRMRPVAPLKPVKQKQKQKRKPKQPDGRLGRNRILTQEQCDNGQRFLCSQEKMTVDAARATLRAAGYQAGDTVLYERIIKPAYSR